jgi:outer membrane protein assembly factor BamE (lipoprotein component of BamABCDE complex)
MKLKLIAVAFFFMQACATAQAETGNDAPASVQISQTTVNGIRLDSKESEIYKTLGKPEKVISRKPNEVLPGKAIEIHYPGLIIYLVGGEILHFECQGSACITNKGIRIGDTREQVERAYGAPSAQDDGKDRIFYAFKSGNAYLDSALVFHFMNSKVIKIEYVVGYT